MQRFCKKSFCLLILLLAQALSSALTIAQSCAECFDRIQSSDSKDDNAASTAAVASEHRANELLDHVCDRPPQETDGCLFYDRCLERKFRCGSDGYPIGNSPMLFLAF